MNRPTMLLTACLGALATATAGLAWAQAPAATTSTATTATTTTATTTTTETTTAVAVAPPATPGMAKALLKGGAAGMGDGEVTFEEMNDGLMVHVVASGLAPGSTHGFHVHEKGQCTPPDFASAGGHFNPAHHAHGGPETERHAGDMPNVVADAAGRVDQRMMLHGAVLHGAEGVVGHAVVLHAAPDDYHTQPTGNSGPRVSCGVITE